MCFADLIQVNLHSVDLHEKWAAETLSTLWLCSQT